MQGWGWKGRQRPRKQPPLSKAEIEEIKTRKHHEAEATRLLRAQEKAKRARATKEVDALIESGMMASAPSNMDLYEEHKKRAETQRLVDDLMLADPEVNLAINQAGQGGAFIHPQKYARAPNLIRQWVADLARLLSKPLNTNKVDRVISARKPK